MSIINKTSLLEIITSKQCVDDSEANRIANEILEMIYVDKKPAEEIPILIGHLSEKQGFKGFEPMNIGNPVFEFGGRYFMEQVPLSGGAPVRVFYHKEILMPIVQPLEK